MKHQRLREERVLPRASCRPMMTAPGSLTHTPALGGHPPLSSPSGPWALPRGQTHPGQVAEPQLQGVAQPVGMVGLHVSPEALRGAGGPKDALQHGLCMDLVWEGWLAPLEGRRHLGMGGLSRKREGDPHKRRGDARNPIRAPGSPRAGVYTPVRTSVGRLRGCGPKETQKGRGPFQTSCPHLSMAQPLPQALQSSTQPIRSPRQMVTLGRP